VGVSTIHYMLRNRLYAGAFEWAGRLYQGTHEPLVTQETWENVQEVLMAAVRVTTGRTSAFRLHGIDHLRPLWLRGRRSDAARPLHLLSLLWL
jgi:hypothetical protein